MLERLTQRASAEREARPEGLALEELLDDVGRPLVGPDVVNGEEVRVLERSGGARLALEALQPLGSAANSGGSTLTATSRPSRVSIAP